MVKWEIVKQESGITDAMKINILGTIRTLIETHGTSDKNKICLSLCNWLKETYGNYWSAVVGKTGEYGANGTNYDSMFLCVKELELGWTIVVFKQNKN